jgi:ABC-type transport system involved in multi-copper enzyme maturation permease subunit
MQRTLAIAALTLKAAFRYRLMLVLAGLLAASVVVLPLIIKHDGTARGFTQILMTYTLSAITALLGFATLWLGCGSLAREVEECQMQMVAVKPIARWQIWLGKWLGILGVNALLLGVASLAVYSLMQWRASQLPPDQQEILRNEVLVARASVKLPAPDIEDEVERIFRERLQQNPVVGADRKLLRDQIRERVKAQFQVTPPGAMRGWRVDVGVKKQALAGKPIYIRTKFFTSDYSLSGTFPVLWIIGPPNHPRPFVKETSLAPETFHEFSVPSEMLDDGGVLYVRAQNLSEATTLLFTVEEGLEVLYPEGGFTLNFFRGVGIIFCWLALLAALGLAASSALSFPVAAFLALSVLVLAFSTGTMNAVIQQGGIMGIDHNTGMVSETKGLNWLAVNLFKVALGIINLVKGFSPVSLLSTGRSISWGMLGLAVLQIIGLAGGVCAAIGIALFTRRELATAQGNQ